MYSNVSMKRYLYLIVGLVLSVAGLVARQHNQAEAKRLAAAIVSQDVAATSTQAAESELRDYVAAHTGAAATYTLQGSYNRDLSAAKAAVAAASAANSQIYAEAQKTCAGKADSVTQAKCNQDYLAKHLQAVPAATVAEPTVATYQRKLTGPWWAPDLAGALLLGGAAGLGIGFVNLASSRPKRRK